MRIGVLIGKLIASKHRLSCSMALLTLLLVILGYCPVLALEKQVSTDSPALMMIDTQPLAKPQNALSGKNPPSSKPFFSTFLNPNSPPQPTLDLGGKDTQPIPDQPVQIQGLDTPLAAGDSIDLQDSVMGLLTKNGSILSDGSIGLPLVGRVSLAGLTVAQARQRLTARYKQYFTDPQLTLRIARRHPIRVYLTGAVVNPGVYVSGKDMRPEALKNQTQLGEFDQQFRFYRLYLADALIMAGGLNYNANIRDVQIHRNYPQPSVLHLNLLALFEGGNTIQDVALQDQDVIEVSTISENSLVLDKPSSEFNRSNLNAAEFKISVIGAVAKPGGYPVHQEDNALTAIAKAGGFSINANTSKVFILHATEQGQLIHREINLQDKKLIGKQPMTEWAALLPNDVIFVDESTNRKMAHFGRDLFLDRIFVSAMFPFFNRLFITH